MVILKYAYLAGGASLYVYMNILSYTHPGYAGELGLKILFSIISLLLTAMIYLMILKPERIFKKSFQELSLHLRIMLYIGVVVAPMISLYYT